MDVVVAASREQQERTKELQKLMESFSIAYQADRQRNTMMMEAVARKHGELSATLEQMTQLRREMGENAGKMFLEVNREAIDHIIEHASATLQQRAEEVGLVAETASRKIEATANRLEVQNARAEALAAELERTQKEVDSLFEKLKEAQVEANEQRRIAYEKTAELAKREAALAGLSLLMQEPVAEIMDTLNAASGSAAPPALAGPSRDAASPADETFAPDPTPPQEGVDGSCAAPPSSEFFEEDGESSPDNPVLSCPPSPPRFRILPVA
jgi:chromosome segregation ATPase